MVQNIIFWLLLVICPPIFWLLGPGLRYYFLAATSLAFIGYLDPYSGVLLVFLSTALFIILPWIARGDRRGRICLVVAVATLIGVIGYNKYLPSIIAQLTERGANPGALIVPLGMSYYIFKMIHVAVDAYRRRVFDAPPSLYFCYLFLFTIFSAGPIQRLDALMRDQETRFQSGLFLDGLTRIAYGFVKQFFVIEFILLEIRFFFFREMDEFFAFDDYTMLSSGQLWLRLVFVYVIGYVNFSAYTDIAIGASRLFGFRISENFNFPIVARSMQEFWQRWHMTLAAWAQAYVYSPLLGLTRNPYLAIYCSFAVIGLWHAGSLNRFIWGLFHATGVIAAARWSRYARKHKLGFVESAPWQVASWLMTQAFVVASMIFVLGEFDDDLLTSARLFLALFGIRL